MSVCVEVGGRLWKANVDEALMTSLLFAFISSHTHKMTLKQQNFDGLYRGFMRCCKFTSHNRAKLATDTGHKYQKEFVLLLF